MSLSFVSWPSVWPFDHWEVMAFWIAARSRITPFANDATRLFAARSIQASRSPEDLRRNMPWKLSTTSLASTRSRTPLYFPRYFEFLTKAYIEVLRTVEDLTSVMSDGVILLTAGTLPGLRTDLRREFKRRGLTYDKALVPDDVLEGRMTRDRVRPVQIAGWPATP